MTGLGVGIPIAVALGLIEVVKIIIRRLNVSPRDDDNAYPTTRIEGQALTLLSIDKNLAVMVDRMERMVRAQEAVSKAMELQQVEMTGFVRNGCPNKSEVERLLQEIRALIK